MAIFGKLFANLRGGKVSSADWEDVLQSLIESDLGAANSQSIIEIAKRERGESSEIAVKAALHSWLSEKPRAIAKSEGRTTTVLVVGVNGTGKTTSCAKLAGLLKRNGESVLLAAADTFRAAAVEQLQTWGTRLELPVISGAANGDPASVAFDAITKASGASTSYLLVDTAGRLHTKSDLMDELGKIRRVIEKVSPVDEVLLVVDATTGQNGIAQAKLFTSSVNVTGLILTKMDGSAKGGIALAIERETGIPVKFVGTGEALEDLSAFDADTYLSGLFDS
ncbi:MAG: signal recognition particle-docking protein FtsY [Actinobacteria bacterium]|jgi:fused signal recognition particle receptor|nr:signal recognition particle-docking protein FtsY [Actinomycetota bacterium]